MMTSRSGLARTKVIDAAREGRFAKHTQDRGEQLFVTSHPYMAPRGKS